MGQTVFLLISMVFLVSGALAIKDMMRKSIVYDKNTPDVFYCPIQKPSGMDKLIVKARPLKKLCEYEGQPLPEDYKSDCYQDVDESNYACKEKYRIMMRTAPPGSDRPFEGKRLARFLDVDKEYYAAAMEDRKREMAAEKKKRKVDKGKKNA
ncbi:uncharacterized protein LOC123320312 [Coccinella septempunctata]|uniref:uncharacterized protein LOC123320312 n=1 Tax=Coccinella septempunctata TaxID=41139 RepID=UPI001D08AEC6|nr:uncharacterized protein LOC123320312 [Coccinella septempunctata]XP_044763541.1 uncharacterized protein LOC123320312 [Coccinella septempunctata]XP_044763542.1 uncharacterized protein LOC123320312 [Coccinella septempunctata]